MLIYESINYPVIQLIPGNVKNILDVGCGNGALGKYLKSYIPDLHVTGITYSEKEANLAKEGVDEVIIADLNTFDFGSVKKFDCIVCSHVLEHCYFPDQVLKNIQTAMKEGSTLIIALPNVLHWKQRLHFFTGKFRYTEGGLMDNSHFRFFDWHSANSLITGSGFKIVTSKSTGNLPLPFIRKMLPKRLNDKIDHFSCKIFPGLFGFQFVFSCRVE